MLSLGQAFETFQRSPKKLSKQDFFSDRVGYFAYLKIKLTTDILLRDPKHSRFSSYTAFLCLGTGSLD